MRVVAAPVRVRSGEVEREDTDASDAAHIYTYIYISHIMFKPLLTTQYEYIYIYIYITDICNSKDDRFEGY